MSDAEVEMSLRLVFWFGTLAGAAAVMVLLFGGWLAVVAVRFIVAVWDEYKVNT